MANTDNLINIGDSWKALDSIQVNVGDTWKDVTEGYINIGDSWKQFWEAVVAGYTLTWGTEYSFNGTDNASYNGITLIDSTHICVCYQDSGNSNYGTAIIGTISNDDEISWGSEYVFQSSATYFISVQGLDSTHFSVTYRDSSQYTVTRIGVISSGNVITYGSVYTANSDLSGQLHSCALDSSTIVLSYQNYAGNDYALSKVGVISSGDVITYGSEYTARSTSSNYYNIETMDSTHFVYTTSGAMYVGTLSSGDVITYGTPAALSTQQSDYLYSIVPLDSTTYAIDYKDGFGGFHDKHTSFISTISSGDTITSGSKYTTNEFSIQGCTATAVDANHYFHFFHGLIDTSSMIYQLSSISGDVVTYGTATNFGSEPSTTVYYTDSCLIDSTHVAVCYNNIVSIATLDRGFDWDLTFGSEQVFNSGYTMHISSSLIDSTHVCVSYRDTSNSSYGTAIIGTISGDTITWGTEYVFNSASVSHVSQITIDSTHVCITYQGGSSYGYAVIGTISNGDEISWGSTYTYNSAQTGEQNVVLLDSTHIAIGFIDGSLAKSTGIIGTISSGNVLTFETKLVSTLYSANTDLDLTCLDSTHICMSYVYYWNDIYYLKSIIGTISGTTLSWGTETNVSNNGDYQHIYYTSTSTIDSTHYSINYYTAVSPYNGHSKIGTISSGDTITFGSEYTFQASGQVDSIDTITIDSTHICITYSNYSISSYVYCIIGTIDNDDELTFGTATAFNSGSAGEYNNLTLLDYNKILINYQDEGNSSYGTSTIATIT